MHFGGVCTSLCMHVCILCVCLYMCMYVCVCVCVVYVYALYVWLVCVCICVYDASVWDVFGALCDVCVMCVRERESVCVCVCVCACIHVCVCVCAVKPTQNTCVWNRNNTSEQDFSPSKTKKCNKHEYLNHCLRLKQNFILNEAI